MERHLAVMKQERVVSGSELGNVMRKLTTIALTQGQVLIFGHGGNKWVLVMLRVVV